MHRYLFKFMNNLRLRWKLLVVVLPLVVVPIFVVGGVIGYISTKQAYLGITQTSKDDLEHMASFTIDLLRSTSRIKSIPSNWNWLPLLTLLSILWRLNTGNRRAVASI